MKKETRNPLIQTQKSNWRILTLNRPQKKNALNQKLTQSLIKSFKNLNKKTKGVMIEGRGSFFCAGADLSWMSSKNFHPGELFNLFYTIFTCEKPVMARVKGDIYGGGLGLIGACDFISAEKGSRFIFSELSLGLAPALISPFILKKMKKGSYWMMTARAMSADQALKQNLIDFSGSKAECLKWEKQLMKDLEGLDPKAFSQTKKLINKIDSLEKIKKEAVQTLKKRLSDPLAQKKISQFLKKSVREKK